MCVHVLLNFMLPLVQRGNIEYPKFFNPVSHYCNITIIYDSTTFIMHTVVCNMHVLAYMYMYMHLLAYMYMYMHVHSLLQ